MEKKTQTETIRIRDHRVENNIIQTFAMARPDFHQFIYIQTTKTPDINLKAFIFHRQDVFCAFKISFYL